MPIARPSRRLCAAVLIAAGVLGASAAEAGGPLDFYYERSLMAAAGARCNLFTVQVRAALDAASAQARNAALRAGRSEPEVQAVRAEAAARAQATACNSADLTLAARRVRTAFEGWSHVTHVTYPGAEGGWSADRTLYRSAQWRLVERAAGGAACGVAGDLNDPAALAAVLTTDGETPYGARLKFRDPARAATPWLVRTGAPVMPPPSALRTVFAEAKGPAGPGLTHGAASGTAFRFPAAAAEALATLDPRERFEVEFLFPGDRVRSARFEVGDFAAGRAFLAMGDR